ncbi:single-pass membrane and coiled-coil domain-containing protein 3-like isoform X2 [Myxocyprinus asiaticus]|uniref:single-pass membrane and coiled-coil domain-containing protein 3-like isoform X2 n=1 Tax=Myxocyprinus asiaticus TaxID=70543 RepID=UPI00222170B3|nr:single-pass membrane and coiled-coil domain-containing protein 3-like isoform X2 [Myxocyprinus asiaticus]
MSWSDIFYPENPERREQLIRKNQELKELMKNNFRATNQLIEVLNKHLCLSFSPIYLNEKATVKQNCDVMIECIHKIQAEVGRIDKELKKNLEPTLYEKLRNNKSLSTTDLKLVGNVISAVCGIAAVTSTFVVGWLIMNGMILARITAIFTTIGTGLLASCVLGVIFMGVDMIVSAILGSIERDQLKKALKEYDEVLDEFRPASERYQDSITYVRIRLEMMEK